MRVALALAFVVGCGSAPREAATSCEGADCPALRILVDDREVVTYFGDGRFEMGELRGHIVEEGGALGVVQDDGEPAGAALGPDGSFHVLEERAFARVDANGTLIVGSRRMTLDDAGMLEGGSPSGASIRVAGLDARNRRAATYLLLLYFRYTLSRDVLQQLRNEYAPLTDAPSTGDEDGDGTPDADDECPQLPEDADGSEDADGCPDFDNDDDGVPDGDDRCPVEAAETDDGCP